MVDQVTAREMILWGENTYEIYEMFMGIVRGIKKSQDKGTYNEDRALVACRRLANTTIKSYQKEFGTFSVNSPTRGEIAQNFLEQALETVKELA